MSEIVENEVQRQLALIEIKEELNKRNAEVLEEIHDLDSLFENTKSKILSSAESISSCIKRFQRTYRKRSSAWKKIWY